MAIKEIKIYKSLKPELYDTIITILQQEYPASELHIADNVSDTYIEYRLKTMPDYVVHGDTIYTSKVVQIVLDDVEDDIPVITFIQQYKYDLSNNCDKGICIPSPVEIHIMQQDDDFAEMNQVRKKLNTHLSLSFDLPRDLGVPVKVSNSVLGIDWDVDIKEDIRNKFIEYVGLDKADCAAFLAADIPIKVVWEDSRITTIYLSDIFTDLAFSHMPI